MLATVRRLETLPEKFLDAAGPKSVELAKIGLRLAGPSGELGTDQDGPGSSTSATGCKTPAGEQRQATNLVVMDLDPYIAYKYHQRGTIPARPPSGCRFG